MTKIHRKSYLTFLPQVFLSNIYMDFQKDGVKWQHSMVNRQRLTPRLTTTFSEITQPVAIHNTFFMSFLDTVSQWNKLDKKKQRQNPTEMKFPTVNRKTSKKGYLDIHLFYQ